MYGKMQESELTEVIPLMCTSAIWGQYPVFSYREFPQGSPKGVAAVCWLLDGRYSSLPVPSGLTSSPWAVSAVLMTVASFVYWYGGQYSICHTLFPVWTYVWCSKKWNSKKHSESKLSTFWSVPVCMMGKQNEIITYMGSVSQKASWRRWIMRWVLRLEMKRWEKIVNSFLLQSFGAHAFLLEGTVLPRFWLWFLSFAQMPPAQGDLSEPACLN